jgi:hypothetical protein
MQMTLEDMNKGFYRTQRSSKIYKEISLTVT